ncbi:hypothetical protein G3576_03895 [Roseomonas stagni]|uniref:Uncharacterized protein n=1 Tax=Falsiroseomonas algicola TaxID=2716930 RepID=A0A6M1LGM6_9PROT|nr:hypothetical protein [Falsiroseomonas algicola]NGM19144.1 hypothetical protein [Falsiroseomonas algicola]
MARSPRRDDPFRDPADDDEREYAPPSKRATAITIAILISAGLTLIAYFILELSAEDLGGIWVASVIGVIGFVLARARLWR